MQPGWKTFGHDPVKRILDGQLSNGCLAHAYLFSGPPGLGKQTLALEFAGKILRTENPQTHLDFQMLEVLEDESEIIIEQVREFIDRLNLKPFLGDKKVAIINNAELLNPQSGNALLKTLEEPGQSAVIILVGDGQRLLPTIRSRCLILNMQSFSRARLGEFAAAAGLTAPAELLDLSFGSPAELVRLSADPERAASRRAQIARWQELKKMAVAERLLAIGGLAAEENGPLTDLILTWLVIEQGALSARPQNFTLAAALQNAAAALRGNQNKKSILQSLLLAI